MGKRRQSGKRKAGPRAFQIVLPATSANLGPAFDCAALALNFHLKVSAEVAAEDLIRATGRDEAICGAREGNLLVETYRDVLGQAGKPAPSLALRIENQIPVGKGCGSSAAARLAGIALAVHFGGLGWTDERILEEAVRREGHADNAAACWHGGIAVAQMGTGALHVATLAAPRWPLLLAVPARPLATEKARAVLPTQVSRADAVANVQSAMLLATAFAQRRDDLLRSALTDKLHQPYRAPLCPLLDPLRALAGGDGILGAVLSGAGPSVLMFLAPRAPQPRVARRVKECLSGAGLDAELIFAQAESRGARERRAALGGKGESRT